MGRRRWSGRGRFILMARFHETRLYDRDLLRPGDTFAGPAIVSEYSSATVLPMGDVLRVDGLGNLVIEVHA